MTFSRRFPPNLAENRLAVTIAEMRRRGQAFLDLTESNPTRAGFEYPDTLLTALGHSRGLAYRPDPRGAIEARTAVSGALAGDAATAPDPQSLVLTVSTSEAYSLLFKLLCDPGDEVLIPQPSYPLFEHLTRLESVVAVPYRLEYHGRWSIDQASVERALSARTRAVLLVSPNNPTGSFVTEAELAHLADVCVRRDMAVISDEVFADYPLSDLAGVKPAALAARTDVLGFTLGGLSKSVGLPQVKLAWTAVTGPVDAVDAALARLELMCDTYLSVSTPVQLAAGELLERGARVRGQIQARIQRNYAACAALVARRPECSVLHADGGWSAVIRVPRLVPEEELVLSLLMQAGVLVHPGYFFDFASESYVIVSLLVQEAIFAEGVRRVLEHVGNEAVS